MFSTKLSNHWSLLYSVSVFAVLGVALWFGASFNTTTASSDKTVNAAPAATFAGTGLGAIPDNSPLNPLNVTFNVNLSGPPTLVEASLTSGGPFHTWVGDIVASLIAPNGTSFILFARTGDSSGTGFGDSSDLIGPYNFRDVAAGTNWWTAANLAGATAPIPSGDYRTTTANPGPIAGPQPVTNLTAAFASVPTVNGTWTMRFTDNAGGDTGSISAATLTIETAPAPVTKKNVDFTGDGKSDFSTTRNITPGFSGDDPAFVAGSYRERMALRAEQPVNSAVPENHGENIGWYIADSTSNAHSFTKLGQPMTDFITPSDYDGDGKADIATWRPSVTPTMSAFYILNSMTSTITETFFGESGDDPAITGDYDGDGKSDLATYRCPAVAGQCFFFYRGTLNNPSGNITYVPWGNGTPFTFFVSPGDFDGDGKFDFCIQRTNPTVAGAGQFVLRRSSDGGVEYINWGRNSDIIVPGDYDGDGKSDFMVSRHEDIGFGNGKSYYLLTRTGGGTGPVPIRWGITTDIRVPGDYDGDGKTDVAVWRPGTNPSQFFVLRSGSGTLQSYQYGQTGDYPVANWNVH